MQVSAVVNRVFELMRKRFKMFVAIGVMPLVAELVLAIPLFAMIGLTAGRQGGEGFPWSTPAPWIMAVLLFALVLVGSLFVYALAETAATWAALRLDAGADATVRQAWQVAWLQAGRSFGLMLLRALRTSGPMILPMLLMVAGIAVIAAEHSPGDPPVTGILLILASVLLTLGSMVLGLILYVADALSSAACVTENLPAWQAIRRSVGLSRGSRWRILGVAFLLYLIVMASMVAIEIVGAVALGLGVLLFELLHAGEAGTVVAVVIAAAIFLPFFVAYTGIVMTVQPVYQAVMYRDLRRLEPVQTAATHPGTGFTGPQFR
jgi:hypothetical protein